MLTSIVSFGVVLAGAIGLLELTLLFQSQWLQVQLVGTVVVGIYLMVLTYMFYIKPDELTKLYVKPVAAN